MRRLADRCCVDGRLGIVGARDNPRASPLLGGQGQCVMRFPFGRKDDDGIAILGVTGRVFERLQRGISGKTLLG